MLIFPDHKSDIQDSHENTDDLPPAYDALSLRHQDGSRGNPHADSSVSSGSIVTSGPTRHLPDDLGSTSSKFPIMNINKVLPTRPLSGDPTSSSPRNATSALAQIPRARKNISWLSLLPFTSSFSAKRVRQSISTVVTDLVSQPSRPSSREDLNVHEIFASIAETCVEHKLSLSTILQELSIADHTPVYWAIVNYREELLVALLVHSQPLSIQTISDIRRACLVNSNQMLFHALRVCQPPFHRTQGLQVPGLQAASDNLLLGDRPLDKIVIQHSTDQSFVVSFEIPLWQRRMKALGQVSVEFITSGRMWSITFFSTDPSSPLVSGKTQKGVHTWHVMVSLLEPSLPTFLDSTIVVNAPHLVPKPRHAPKLREAQSMTFPPSRDQHDHNRYSTYDYNHYGKAVSRSSQGDDILGLSKKDGSPSFPSQKLRPPIHPLRGSSSSTATPSPICIHLRSGNRKLGCRSGLANFHKTLTTKPDTWSDHGVGYTTAVVSSLEEGPAVRLLYEPSQYLLPDGTLIGRLEAKLVKSELSKDCIVC